MGKKFKKPASTAKRPNPTQTGNNPFESRFNKQRHDVLGRKKKNDRGMPGVSRNKSLKKREKSLLNEYKQLNKVNNFVDRRIGENEATVDPEERALARFAKEWRKSKKSTMFNLNDEDLTHMGKSLSEIEVFDDARSDSEDEDDKLSSQFIKKAHFGGFMTMKNANTVEPERSHKEIMQELISETKKQKYERQTEREATVNLTDKLDEDWKSLQKLVGKSKQSNDSLVSSNTKDSYDIAVKSLKYEIKGTPVDRLKTEEELAKEESEKIARLEEDRQKRMKGLDQLVTSKVSHISADSLDDGIALDTDPKELDDSAVSNENENEEMAIKNTSDDNEDEDQDSDNESSSSGENIYTGMLSEESDSEHDDNSADDDDRQELITQSVKSKKNLPEDVPSSLEDLLNLFSNKSVHQKIKILEHVLKKNHISLGAENRHKMESLFEVLLQYMSEICCVNQFDLDMIDALVPILYNLLQLSPTVMSKSLIDCIALKRKSFMKQRKNKNERKIPYLDTLILFKLVSIFYPTSDFHHPVVTAAEVFMSEVLVHSKITTLEEIAKGIFVCGLFLEYVYYAKRFVPEVLAFLKTLLSSLVSATKGKARTISNLLSVSENCDTAGHLPLKWLVKGEEIPATSETSLMILNCCIGMLHEFAKLYRELPSFDEIFEGLQPSCEIIKSQDRFQCLRNSVQEFQESLDKEISKKSPLVQNQKAVKSIRMYEPRIQADFTGKKQRPVMSAKKAERQKLLYKYKKEFKGAAREIRRDNQYLSRMQLNEQLERDNERKEKVKRLYQDLAQQEGDFKRYKKRR